MKRSNALTTLIFCFFFCFVTTAYCQEKPKSAGKYYFPSKPANVKTAVDDKMDDFTNRWYSSHLASMNEPILFDKTDKNLNVFRYTHLGSNSNPFTIRVERIDTTVRISFKQTDGLGGYDPGKIIKDLQKELSIRDWNTILAKVESTHFLKMNTYRIDPNGMLLDGAEWIFESLSGSNYHFVTRNMPATEGDKEYAKLCTLLQSFFPTKD